VALDGGGSEAAPDSTIVGYAWSGVEGEPVFVGATTGDTATVAVPESGEVTVRLEVTDDEGRKGTRDVTLGRKASGGGGGAVHPLALLVLGLAAYGRLRRRG
jgi:MYXO-CTERM domain-containing protein